MLSPADKILYATLLESLLASSTDDPWAIEATISYPQHNYTNLRVAIHRSQVYRCHMTTEHQETVHYLTETNNGRRVSLYDIVDF
ncbi:uncharacterized protein BDW43DRAFT_276119 [Aspergillus alliaceus]|uniref:uncharacterized protein n=1 Tax=Petromyces alliaceus TaxID=209559 RepID=UPI0012A718F0|nr:uncharacterized protein BDW43DRAFT_276119 [Aspergillus alliaceus]KAB8233372.1 hypothetical protein BDW43DRAFT_276119 [Aspergillus alliaceus]